MRSVLTGRPEVHESDLTVSITCVKDDPDLGLHCFIVSSAPTYRFKLPRDESIFALTPHSAAKHIAEADARAGELINKAVAFGGSVKVARHRVYRDSPDRDSPDRESIEKVIDEWAYSLISGQTTVEDAERELRTVFDAYPEYSDSKYGGGDFMAMVRRFADDDFCKCHHLANEYLRAAEANEPTNTFRL